MKAVLKVGYYEYAFADVAKATKALQLLSESKCVEGKFDTATGREVFVPCREGHLEIKMVQDGAFRLPTPEPEPTRRPRTNGHHHKLPLVVPRQPLMLPAADGEA